MFVPLRDKICESHNNSIDNLIIFFVKPSKSSLYREIENLIIWFIPIGNNIPKDFALRKLGERMLNDLLDALNATALALQTQDLQQRLELINLVKLHITSAQSISKVLVEYSSRDSSKARIISQKQRAALLASMTSIGTQLAKWGNSTQSAL